MVFIEKIELCYDAHPSLEWVATEEAGKFVDIYQRLQQLDSLSVHTYLHQWRYSSELIFQISGEEKSLEESLRILYKEAGIPAAIAKSWISSPSSKKAIEISEKIIREIKPDYNMKELYVDSCASREVKKKTA